jgi:uncharacterized protein (DUF1501 family)
VTRRPDTSASCIENQLLSRRHLLGAGAASLALWSFMPRAAIAGTRDPRLLTIVLRGGLDGLSLAAPIADPDYVRLRQNIAMPSSGEKAGLALDGFFALNPNMPFLHGLYTKREALIAHAIHTPYRGRSHFDGQDVLESGAGTGRTDDGWLNRALAALPSAGQANPKGLAMDAVVPLVMRGGAPVLSWIPKVYNRPLADSTIARLMDLYTHTDAKLARAFAAGLEIERVADAGAATAAAPAAQMNAPQMDSGAMMSQSPRPAAAPGTRPFREFTEAAEAAAKFLASADGPRIGALSYNGWDTHANEGVIQGQLGNRLAGLDAAIRTLHDGLGTAWKDTVVVIVTEFGRTARVNGTDGTDHGTATCALLVGGAVKGGRILASWPGLTDANLHDGRDLAATMDLRSLLKGVLRDHLGLPDNVLANKVFPDSVGAAVLRDLVA